MLNLLDPVYQLEAQDTYAPRDVAALRAQQHELLEYLGMTVAGLRAANSGIDWASVNRNARDNVDDLEKCLREAGYMQSYE